MKKATRKEFSDAIVQVEKVITKSPIGGVIEYYNLFNQDGGLIGLLVNNNGDTVRYLPKGPTDFAPLEPGNRYNQS